MYLDTFQAATFEKTQTSVAATFFSRPGFLQHIFLEALPFHSYASFSQLHFLFIC